MAFLKKLFGKGEKTPKGFHSLTVANVTSVGTDTVKVEFDIPSELKKAFDFTPGQYINFSISVDGKEHRRSYSICSGKNENLAVAIKKVEKGIISTWFQSVETGTAIFTSSPEGSFILPSTAKKVVAIAAGSGITPILSIAKSIEQSGGELLLFYGNKTENEILFNDELNALTKTKINHYLSQEDHSDHSKGRIDKDAFSAAVKNNLDLLKSDIFFICGPEQMIMDINDTLKLYGVSEDKIKFELFTAPTLMKSTEKKDIDFKGTSHVTLIVDGDPTEFDLDAKKIILDKAIDEDVDAPYSCKGGVCSSCKAKVIKGDVHMKAAYTLTDKEIEEGYILTCQAYPRSEELVITYDF